MLAFSSDNKQIATIADHSIHIVNVTNIDNIHSAANIEAGIPWSNIPLRPRGIAFSKDAKWLAINCDDGMIWFYSIQTGQWGSIAFSNASVFWGEFSNDSRLFVATDSVGQVTIIDMQYVIRG